MINVDSSATTADTESITIRIPTDLHAWLGQVKKNSGSTKTWVIVQALREYKQRRESELTKNKRG